MSKVYELTSDFEFYSHFSEQYQNVDNSFIQKYWSWKSIDLTAYHPVIYKLYAGDNRKKNYTMDVSSFSDGLIIFSEKAIKALRPILEDAGQIVPVITESKRKKFYGFYPNKNSYGDAIINLEKSEFHQYEEGKLFYKIVLNHTYPKNDYIFTLDAYPMGCLVTERFKELTEEHDLKGFDFSEYREIKIED